MISTDRTTPPEASGYLRILIALILIEVFAVFETSMAIAAIPSFMRIFGESAAAAGWTTTAYLLVGGCFAATAGRLGDIFGRRKVLVIVLAIAALGSLISVLAGNLLMITLGRGVQGMAAGALPLSFGLVREVLPRQRVPLAVALLSGVIPICAGAGALLAGILLDLSGWRMIFVVACVLGIIASLIALVGVPNTPGITPRPTVDILGAVLLIPAIGGVLFGVSNAREWGWDHPGVLGSIVLGVVAMAVWVWWERRVHEPVVDVRQFTNRQIGLTTLATILIGIGPMGAASLLPPMIMQLPGQSPVGLGMSPTTSGLVMLIASVIGYGGAAVSGRIATVFGARWALAIGCVLHIIGAAGWIAMAQNLPGSLICISLLSIGSAFGFASMANLIIEVVPSEQTGAATGMNRVAVNVSVAAGLSITSVIISSSTVPGTHLPTATALTAACLYIIGCTVVGLVLTLLIGPRRRQSVDEQVPNLSGEQAPA